MQKLFEDVENNLKTRFDSAKTRFGELLLDKHASVLTQKLLYLHTFDPGRFVALFQKITNWNLLSTLEGIESINSFIGNFYDDSYYKIEYRTEVINMKNNIRSINLDSKIEVKLVVPEDDPDCWTISWSNDDKNFIKEEQLIDVIDKVIERENHFRRLYEESEKDTVGS